MEFCQSEKVGTLAITLIRLPRVAWHNLYYWPRGPLLSTMGAHFPLIINSDVRGSGAEIVTIHEANATKNKQKEWDLNERLMEQYMQVRVMKYLCRWSCLGTWRLFRQTWYSSLLNLDLWVKLTGNSNDYDMQTSGWCYVFVWYTLCLFIGKWVLMNEQEKHVVFSHKIHSLNHSRTNVKCLTLV